ncbi:MAG: hypothetical protein QFB87_04485 [Patescibacteria group bacterium]|nr:hypothetical protein [Patescibacteria group bacterium]
MLFDKTCSVEYRTVSGVYNNLQYVAHPTLTAVPVNIQPMAAQFNNATGGVSYKNYKVFTTVSGVVEGMRLTVAGTNEQFIVVGRQRFDYIVAPHYELIVEADKQ